MAMRVVTAVALVVILCVAVSASALDKLQSALEQPGGLTGTSLPALVGSLSTTWLAGTSKGSLKHSGCKFQVKLSHTNLGTGDGTPGTGDEVICLGDANIAYEGVSFPTTAVFRGERNAGAINIKVDLAVETAGPGSCGAVRQPRRLRRAPHLLRVRPELQLHGDLQRGLPVRSDPGCRGRHVCPAAGDPADRDGGHRHPLSDGQLSLS